MSIAVVNSSNSFAAGSATTTTSAAQSLTAGNSIIVGFRQFIAQTTILSMTDTAGNVYRQITGAVTSQSGLAVWYATDVIGNGSNVITITHNASTNRCVCTVQVSGLIQFPLDTWALAPLGISATPTTSAFTTAFANEIILIFGDQDTTGSAWSASAGYTIQTQDSQNILGVATKIVSAIQTGVTSSITSADSSHAKVAVAVAMTSDTPSFVPYGPSYVVVPDADSNSGLFGVSIDSNTGVNVNQRLPLGAFSGRGSGEGGAQLANGTFIVGSKGGSADRLQTFQIYDQNFTQLSITTPLSNANAFSPIASDFSGMFWVSSGAQVRSVTTTGTLGSATYTLDENPIQAMGVSQDNAVLYYAGQAAGAHIKRWDLVNNVSLGSLVTPTATTGWGEDIIIVPSTLSFVVITQPDKMVDAFELRLYNAVNGTLISSVPFAGAINNFSDPRLSLDLGAPYLSVWARLYPDGTGATTTFQQIRLSDGSTLQQFTVPMGEAFVDGPSVVPLSCPFFAWSNNVPSPVTLRPPWPLVPPFVSGVGGLETVPQRRLRVAPHLSAEQFNIFYDQFTLDLQVGNGLLVGQGVTPQIMLRMSDDGGYTWSDEILLDSGAQGQYLTRVTANGLGMARDRVFEISTSDPVAWSIISAFLQTRKGRW